MDEIFRFGDELGPGKVLHIYLPKLGLRSVVAVDNTACGASIGGVRFAPDVTAQEACRLARAMTLKNAAAGLPHGGGKAVIAGDPKMDAGRKEEWVRAFAKAISNLEDYIPGPDMGTDEMAMGWIQDEIGRAVGLPRELGGIPLDEIGATGFGLSVAIEVAAESISLTLHGARVAIQGFGAVGKHAARFLVRKGCRIVACSDTRGTVSADGGLDVGGLIALKDAGKSVTEFAGVEKGGPEAILGVPCDVWIPAARPDVVNRDNAAMLETRMVAEGANIPCTLEAEAMLAQRGVLVLPDFVVNAGGVICAAIEYHGGAESSSFGVIEEKIRRNTASVLETAMRSHASTRDAAIAMATQRVHKAAQARRWG